MSSARSFQFITASLAQRLHARHIAKLPPSQPAMLDSAVNSPVSHERYGQTDLFQLAGILAEKMALNHAFQDGNKRTALCAADMFLKMNGCRLQRKDPTAEFDEGLADAHVAIATHRWTAEELGGYYASLAGPLEGAGGGS